MGFFRKDQQSHGKHPFRTTALVLEATAPPEGGPSIGPGSRGSVRIQADPGSGSRAFDGKIRMIEEHWLVPGMEVPVTFDGQRPEQFEIDWDAIPSMEARAGANDPALAEPVVARRKVAHALGLSRADTGSSRTERVERALAQRAEQPAPPGKLPGVVLIATIRGRRKIVGDANNDSTHDQLTYERKSAAVLSVNVLGRPPYALYVRKFKCETDLIEPLWTPLPALVSIEDPADVEILWDEVPSHDVQLMNRIASSVATRQAQTQQVDQLRAALSDAVSPADASAPNAAPAVDMAALGSLAPDMQKLAADNAKRALAYVKDPKMRAMLIDQYRAAGIDVGENDQAR